MCSSDLFKANVSILIFCQDDLSIDVSRVYPTIIVFLLISSFMSVNICFMYLGALILGAYIFTVVISSSWIDP